MEHKIYMERTKERRQHMKQKDRNERQQTKSSRLLLTRQVMSAYKLSFTLF